MKYRIVLNGTVQGVGCRYLVSRVAKSMHLGGIVRNTGDGYVEIYTESNSDQIIENFVKEIKSAAKNTAIDIMRVSIYTEDQNEFYLSKPPEDYSDFKIAYDF